MDCIACWLWHASGLGDTCRAHMPRPEPLPRPSWMPAPPGVTMPLPPARGDTADGSIPRRHVRFTDADARQLLVDDIATFGEPDP